MGQRYTYRWFLLLLAACLSCLSALRADDTVEFWCSVDDHTRALPSDPASPWKYNDMDGNRGVMLDHAAAVVQFEKPSNSSYRGRIAELKDGDHSWFGMYYGLGHLTSDRTSFLPAAVYSPLIKDAYQPRITAVRIIVNDVNASQPRPKDTPDLRLKVELKGFSAGGEVIRKTFVWGGDKDIGTGDFPKTLTAEFDPGGIEPIGIITWVLGNATEGDSIEIDALSLRVEIPALAPRREAFLTSLGMLLANYDRTSGMVNDKAHDRNNELENVTATGKLAKILAMAIVGGFVNEQQTRGEIVKIANAFINVLPKGPPGKNKLLAHFTKDGGTEKVSGSEWASGDSAYALLDLLVALQMIGDPDDQLDDVLDLIRDIDWPTLKSTDGAFRHGYTATGELIPYEWKGFGAETLGVLLAAHIGDGLTGVMAPPPTDNGAGFIIHAAYPVAGTGIDKYANNWLALRKLEIARQISWYKHPDHLNSFYAANHLYGLSAAEAPDGRSYDAYGVGGRYAGPLYRDSAGRDVIVGHYGAMASALEPQAAEQMYATMKALGIMTPLNNVESISVSPRTSEILLNPLKGSWNLALQAEGWALSLPEIDVAVRSAFHNARELDRAWRMYFPSFAAGDFNHDGSVNLCDFARLGSRWHRFGCDQSLWCTGTDINNDTVVDFADAEILFQNWLSHTVR